MLNLKVVNFSDLTLDANKPTQFVDLDPGLPTSALQVRIFGSLTVTGSNADGTVIDDQGYRLIRRIRLTKDGEPIIRDIPGRDMAQVSLRAVQNAPDNTAITDAQAQAAATYAFEYRMQIPFSSPWLAKPWDTHLPGLFVRNSLRLEIEFETSATNGSSDPGSAGIVASGSDAYTFASGPTVEIKQIGHPRRSDRSRPQYLRMFEQFVTDDWSAASPALVERWQSERAFDLAILRSSYGANALLQDSINEVTLISSREEIMRDVPLEILRAMEEDFFPAVSGQTGYLGILFASGGLLSNILEPIQHPNLRFLFDVDAPTSGDGLITITTCQLVRPGGENG